MNVDRKLWGVIVLAMAITFAFAACGDSGNPTSPSGNNNNHPIGPPNTDTLHTGALRAETVAASNNPTPRILDYFSENGRNWYIIDAGFIRSAFVMQMGPTEYLGVGTVTLTRNESVESSITRSNAETVSNSIVVTDGSAKTISLEEAIRAGLTATVGGDSWGGSIQSSLEVGLTNRVESTIIFETATERSRETSQSFMTNLTEVTASSISASVDRNDPIGHYRYAWYAVIDVYFIISTSLDNQRLLSWDVFACAREGLIGRFEYSSDGRFDNSPSGNLIVFTEGFHRTLPIPTLTYLLTTDINIDDGGRVTRTPDAMRYNAGSQVTVTAIPNPGYEFVNWTGTGAPMGAAANNAGITVRMNSDLTLTANFEQIPITYSLTTSVNNAQRGSVSRSPNQPSYAPGTQVTVTATPTSGTEFINWTGTGAPAGTTANSTTIIVIMDADLTLTANFGVQRRIDETFAPRTPPHTYRLPDNVRFPATIEVYAIGAGGGGQGDHSARNNVGQSAWGGTGGAGGGGAAVFMKFETYEPENFTINVGRGGTGGEGFWAGVGYHWRAGHSGSDGGSTNVTWSGGAITVAGGRGGGMFRASVDYNRDMTGGTGGSAISANDRPSPISLANWDSRPGGNGGSGIDNGRVESRGGNAGRLNIGSINPFADVEGGWNDTSGNMRNPGIGGGGAGGQTGPGGNGGNGHVRIIVTWLE